MALIHHEIHSRLGKEKCVKRVLNKASNVLWLGLALLVYEPAFAAACEQDNNKLTGLLGLDSSDGRVYVNVESQSNECSCGYFRFKSTNVDTKMALSILLAAKDVVERSPH